MSYLSVQEPDFIKFSYKSDPSYLFFFGRKFMITGYGSIRFIKSNWFKVYFEFHWYINEWKEAKNCQDCACIYKYFTEFVPTLWIIPPYKIYISIISYCIGNMSNNQVSFLIILCLLYIYIFTLASNFP